GYGKARHRRYLSSATQLLNIPRDVARAFTSSTSSCSFSAFPLFRFSLLVNRSYLGSRVSKTSLLPGSPFFSVDCTEEREALRSLPRKPTAWSDGTTSASSVARSQSAIAPAGLIKWVFCKY